MKSKNPSCNTAIALGLAALYFLLLLLFAELSLVNVIFITSVLLLYFLHAQTRLFLTLGFPYVIHSIIYDSVRFLPAHWFGRLHIEDVYRFDVRWFGVPWQGQKIFFGDFLLKYAHPIFDSIAGVIYFFHEPGLLFLCLVLFFRKRHDLFHRVGLAFLLMNLMAILTNILMPVAPPWYVDQYGFMPPAMKVLGNSAGLIRFDQLLGFNFYQNIYSYNPIVFGAIPSMHAGVTLLTVLFAYRYDHRWLWPALAYFLVMVWAAVYLRHHYVVDVLAGVLYCGVAVGMGDWLARRPWRVIRLFNAGQSFYQLHHH